MTFFPYPGVSGEESPGLGVILELLGEPKSDSHDEGTLDLSDVDVGADGGARVLDEVDPLDHLLAGHIRICSGGPAVKQTHKVIYFGDGTHGRSWIP